ncbi:cytochrome P450 [Penicillium sp. IBT 35674x]|nr:cytochrome P450 [Penicillium sp. IBT 35674x]
MKMFIIDKLILHMPYICVLSITVFLTYKTWHNYVQRGKLPLPPSPPGIPILGNLIEFVKDAKKASQHLLLQRWAEEYGDILGVKLGPMTEYYLSSDRAVKNQRRIIHSCMTSVPKADDGLKKLLDFCISNPQSSLTRLLALDKKDGQTRKSGIASPGILIVPSLLKYSAWRSGIPNILGVGHVLRKEQIPDTDNPATKYIHETGLAQILGTLPGSYMVDMLPFLDVLPMFIKPWERSSRARFRRDLEWSMERVNRIKYPKPGDPKIPQEGFLQTLLQNSSKFGVEPEEAGYLSLMVVMAAADTSQMTTWSFFEAMLQFPDVQKKAQKEIDDVVGDRIPVFEDLDSIPYVRCMMKEVWRWRPPVALGHPHVTTKELEYGGYRIPKGSRIHINAWAIGHDANRHEDPERFWPERYSHDQTTTMQSINSPDVTQRDHFAFGSGRRVCPGYHVAERSLGVSIMRLLWAFDIKPSPTAKLPLDSSQYRGQPPGNPNSDLPVFLSPRNGKDELIRKAFDDAMQSRAPMAQL